MLVFLDTHKDIYDRHINYLMVSLKRKGLKVKNVNQYIDGNDFINGISYVIDAISSGSNCIYIFNNSPYSYVKKHIGDVNEDISLDIPALSDEKESGLPIDSLVDISLCSELYKRNMLYFRENDVTLKSYIKYRLDVDMNNSNINTLKSYIDFSKSNKLVSHLCFNNLNFPVLTILDSTDYYGNDNTIIKTLRENYNRSKKGTALNNWLEARIAYPLNILVLFYKIKKLFFRYRKNMFMNNDIFNSYIFKHALIDLEEKDDNNVYLFKESTIPFIERTIFMYAQDLSRYSDYINLPRIQSLMD